MANDQWKHYAGYGVSEFSETCEQIRVSIVDTVDKLAGRQRPVDIAAVSQWAADALETADIAASEDIRRWAVTSGYGEHTGYSWKRLDTIVGARSQFAGSFDGQSG